MPPEPSPTLVHTFSPAVASVQQYISPEVLLYQRLPTPPDGFVVITGSLVDTVKPGSTLVNWLPSTAGILPEPSRCKSWLADVPTSSIIVMSNLFTAICFP